MRTQDDRIKDLLKRTLPPLQTNAEPSRDLWPALLRRMDADAAKTVPVRAGGSKWVWFDWALMAGLAAMALAFPASIPLLLYYL